MLSHCSPTGLSWNICRPYGKYGNPMGFGHVLIWSHGEVVNVYWKSWDPVDSHPIPLVPNGCSYFPRETWKPRWVWPCFHQIHVRGCHCPFSHVNMTDCDLTKYDWQWRLGDGGSGDYIGLQYLFLLTAATELLTSDRNNSKQHVHSVCCPILTLVQTSLHKLTMRQFYL